MEAVDAAPALDITLALPDLRGAEGTVTKGLFAGSS